MSYSVHFTASQAIERPRYVWLAILLQIGTALGAIPVGLMLMADPSGAGIGLPAEWIASSPFGTYLVPGLYLFAMNGVGMLAGAGLSYLRHWSAPWLMGTLGSGLTIWILVQLAIMPEVHWLQWLFLCVGIVLGFVALFWLRRTGQLRLW
jgi:hypothetical protein